jgi:hypothetical protein
MEVLILLGKKFLAGSPVLLLPLVLVGCVLWIMCYTISYIAVGETRS